MCTNFEDTDETEESDLYGRSLPCLYGKIEVRVHGESEHVNVIVRSTDEGLIGRNETQMRIPTRTRERTSSSDESNPNDPAKIFSVMEDPELVVSPRIR